MKNDKEKQSIKDLSTALLKVLESKNYSAGRLAYYRRILLRIGEFMKKKKIAHYSENVGDIFFSDYISKKACSIHYRRYVKTVLRRLNELYNGHDFSLAKKPLEILPPPPFAGLGIVNK